MKESQPNSRSAILSLLHLSRLKGWKKHWPRRWGGGNDTAKVEDRAAVFPVPAEGAYEARDRRLLLDLARRTLATAVSAGAVPEVSEASLPPRLAAHKACFVTLKKHGALRGCIGHLQPQAPLYRAVMDNTLNAALYDPRFPPLTADEMGQLSIEISVLTEPQPLRFDSPEELLGKLQAGRHGVFLQVGGRGATFLPQVWHQIPDKVEFLNQLARKAGCRAEEWRGKEVTVSVYHVESFDESNDPACGVIR